MDSRKNIKNRAENKPKISIGFLKAHKLLTIIIGSLIALNVLVSVTSSSKGTELIGLETEIAKLKLENSELKEKIVKNRSLTSLSELTEDLGLAKPNNIFYLKLNDQVAQVQ